MSFLRDALLVAGKDLRIERRSRVALQQIIPFGVVVVMLFAFALDSDRTLLHQAAPGLFWAAVLLAVLLAVGRSFAIEEANRARDGLRLSGLDGGSIFLGKAAAVAVEMFLLEVIVGAAVVVLYDVSVRGAVVLLLCGCGRDRRIGGHRYGLRRAGRRIARPRDARAAARAPGGHAGDAGRDALVPGRARRYAGRRVAVGAAARRVRGARGRRRHRRVRTAPGGSMKRLFLAATVVALAVTAVFALWITPPRANQGFDAVRLLYLHAPTAWIAYLAFGVTALASLLWLVPRTRDPTWDLLAGASAEVGVVFTGLTLVLGSLWGRPDVGHLVGVGRPPHHHRDPLLPLPRLPRPAPHRRDRRRAREAQRDRGTDRLRRRSDQLPLGHVVADPAPAGHGVQRAEPAC